MRSTGPVTCHGKGTKAALLADLRHDLRTPLTVIAGYATALEDGTASGEHALRAARAIGGEAARLERLVDELGAVERLRRGSEGLRPEALDANDLLRAAIDRFAAAAAAAGIELSIVSDASTPDGKDPSAASAALTFVADRGAVERILANLISNALAAAPSPGGHVWLSAAVAGAPGGQAGSTEAGVESLVLAVTDDGPGFPPGTAARAFERFFRADPSRHSTGIHAGLGLAIVKEYVERMYAPSLERKIEAHR